MNLIAKIAPDIEANANTVIAPELIAIHEIFLNLLEFSSGGHIYNQVITFLIDPNGFITKLKKTTQLFARNGTYWNGNTNDNSLLNTIGMDQ